MESDEESTMKDLDQIISNLPAGRRAKISARTRQLIAEEIALRSLRRLLELALKGKRP